MFLTRNNRSWHKLFQAAVGQIIVVVLSHLNVVLEEDLVMMTAIAREDTVVAMAIVKTFIPQLQKLVVVVQVKVIPTELHNKFTNIMM